MISRKEVARAEQALAGDGTGVRDELGLLAIHQAVADRLFPGTSVLHTHLRYALFVPWLLQRAAARREPTLERLEQLEKSLTLSLKQGVGEPWRGVIGARVHPNAAAQPPSFSYWSALSEWKIFHPQYAKSRPSRESVMRMLMETKSVSTRSGVDDTLDDGSGTVHPFQGLPPAPAGFLDQGSVATFELKEREKQYLSRKLAAVRGPGSEQISLLGRLATEWTDNGASTLWADPSVRRHCRGDEMKVIDLAQGASSLGAIARGVYAALVERECEKFGIGRKNVHAPHLQMLLETHGETACRLHLADLELLLGKGNGRLMTLLTDTQAWLKADSQNIRGLHRIYKDTERFKKPMRERLANTPGARQRLVSWFADDESTKAQPLHYRWSNVVRILRDLHA